MEYYEQNWLTHLPASATATAQWVITQNAVDVLMSTTRDNVSIQSMIAATKRMPLGINPFVMLSGGVDSQAACILLRLANIPFTAAILRFNGGFNDMDVNSAVSFCNKHNINYIIQHLNITKFLTTELSRTSKLYECPSPQFCAHFKFFSDIVTRYSPSCLICGGTAPYFEQNKLCFKLTRSQSAWETYSRINNIPVIGNFLGWSVDIAAPLIITTPNRDVAYQVGDGNRYADKIQGFHALGLNVTPQTQKYTGFERVKDFFEEMTGDGWAFENMFRIPLQVETPEWYGELTIQPELNNHLLHINEEFQYHAHSSIST